MNLHGVKIGFALTGSHCTIGEVLPQIEKLIKAGTQVFPIISPAVNNVSTRFGEAKDIKERLKKITGNRIIKSIVDAEPIGPQKMFDIIVIAPCTGNTLAKLANGITDTPVLMSAKAQLRNQRPVVLAISTNDGLGLNAKNLGILLATKNIFIVPFGQDDPLQKPTSLVSRLDLLLPTIEKALKREQIQPILLSNFSML
ncbi:MAG TPA: dipicolinate synthase subunit B [Firmicutes bacterium]|nr:dipicolinate synthase subunit B [Bacillota bacterium]HAA34802.1 dipicolinate synthase subunit B [Bacillota bacterium]